MRVKTRREPERRERKGKDEAENCGKLKEKDIGGMHALQEKILGRQRQKIHQVDLNDRKSECGKS